MAAVTIYSVEGLAGLGGRLALRPGAATGSAPSRCSSSACWPRRWRAGAYFFARQLGEFYAVAAVFGMIYGGVMPLYAVIAREYFPMRIMGTVFGAATSSPASAWRWVRRSAAGSTTTGSYGWLYIGSFGIGLGAFVIALTLRPVPTARPVPVPA